MSRVSTLKTLKKLLVPGVLSAAIAVLIGLQSTAVSAQRTSQLWSIVAHFEYQDGFEYDYVIATGVPTGTMPSLLADCGSSHWTGSVVRYHCFPVLE